MEQEMLYVSTIEAKMHPVISPTNPEVSIVEKPKWTIIYKRSINIIALSLALKPSPCFNYLNFIV